MPGDVTDNPVHELHELVADIDLGDQQMYEALLGIQWLVK